MVVEYVPPRLFPNINRRVRSSFIASYRIIARKKSWFAGMFGYLHIHGNDRVEYIHGIASTAYAGRVETDNMCTTYKTRQNTRPEYLRILYYSALYARAATYHHPPPSKVDVSTWCSVQSGSCPNPAHTYHKCTLPIIILHFVTSRYNNTVIVLSCLSVSVVHCMYVSCTLSRRVK